MILAVIFCVFALVAIIRLAAFAVFTAKEKNSTGAAMLWSFAFVILVCSLLAIIRL